MNQLHRIRMKRLLVYLLVFCFISNMSLGSVRANEITDTDTIISEVEAGDDQTTESSEDLTGQPSTDDGEVTSDQTEAESATDVEDGGSVETPGFIYDTQPVSMEEIQSLIEAWQAGEGVKPCWEYEVEESLMPAGWRCDYLTDGSTGAVYWTFFLAIQTRDSSIIVFDETGLQNAINNAVITYAGGDTSGQVIIIDNNIALTNDLTISGPANITFASVEGVTLTAASGCRHITISNNGTTIAGDVMLNFVDVVLEGGFTNSGETNSMGGIATYLSGILTLTGVIIRNCYQYNASGSVYGGGVYVEGDLVLDKCTVTGNVLNDNGSYSSAYGGGIYVSGDITVTNSAIRENKYLDSNGWGNWDNLGGGIYSYGDITILGNTDISGNTAESGGGIYSFGDITISGGAISDNTANSNGGGVFGAGDITLSGGTISNNTAEYGGGIFRTESYDFVNDICSDGETVTLSGGIISENISGNSGGGVYCEGYVTISDNAEISENTSAYDGGGIYCRPYYGYDGSDYSHIGGDVTLSSGTISDNTVKNGCGGGVYNTGKFVMLDGVISQNVAGEEDEGGYSYGYGGGIYSGGTVEIQGGTISYNTTAIDGGGIYVQSYNYNDGISVQISGGTIQYNEATRGNGGGVYSLHPLTLDGGIIEYNVAGYCGGGIYVGASSAAVDDSSGSTASTSVIIKNGEVRYNKAVDGGGIYLLSGGSNVAPSSVRYAAPSSEGKGSISVEGGAIHNNDAISGDTESGNKFGGDGGGIYCIGDISVTDGDIYENTAEVNGGGIYIVMVTQYVYPKASTELLVSGGKIRDNEAENGGGIYSAKGASRTEDEWDDDVGSWVYFDVFYGASITIKENAEITGNTASSGGGVYGNCDTTVTGGTISGNTAKNGGGIYGPRRYIETQVMTDMEWDDETGDYIYIYVPVYYINESVLTISGGTIGGNVATVSGGGVYSSGDTTMTGGTVSGNKAASGGGFYAAAGGERNGYEYDDTNYEYVEAMFSFDGSTLTLSGSTITGNTAASDGGGIYLAADADDSALDAALNATGTTTIKSNHADGYGGGIYTGAVADYANLTVNDYRNITTAADTNFDGNTANAGYDPPANAAAAYPDIAFASVSVQATIVADSHPINNYDINYIGNLSTYYTVTYDPNGGSGVAYSVSVVAGGSHTVLDNSDINLGYTKADYTFDGWNTAANGNATDYTAGDNINNITANVILYAQWEPVSGDLIKITVDIGDVYWWVPSDENQGSAWTTGSGYNEVSATNPEGGWSATEKGKVYAPTYNITNNSGFGIDVSVHSFKTNSTEAATGDILNLNIKWNGIENTTTPLVNANNDLNSGTTIALGQMTAAGGLTPTATFSFAGTWNGTYRTSEIPYEQTMVLNFKKQP